MEFTAVRESVALFSSAEFEWAICGGWALDIFAGRKTRSHKDLDICVWRKDQQILRKYFSPAQWHYFMDGKEYNWRKDCHLELPVHEIHCVYKSRNFEFLLCERDSNLWIYRRNTSIRRPVNDAFIKQDGFRILAPEIVLLYKSKALSSVDDQDFLNILEFLSGGQKRWLFENLKLCYGTHPWLKSLGP